MQSIVRGFVNFNKGVLKMPIYWQLWLVLLATANMVVPLFFSAQQEARVAF